ncbi:MAG TPA: hypothetical protein VKW06_20210 [Candidatus Angelobacter sp.]|nr:hypothetical protein [Candidatus Angelobacter sp.]
MAKFDLSKTGELADLFATARAQRDQNWKQRFYSAVVDASMATTPQQVLRGPDGFSYFVLNIPPAGQPFETFCVSHVLDVCLDNGFGIVIQPDANPPQWVFNYGNLWSFKSFGKFEMERPAAPSEPKAPVASPQPLLVGQPSLDLFPAYARKAVKAFLVAATGNADPQVLLLNDARQDPPQSLVFSVFPEDFAGQSEFEQAMYRLTWFLPSHYRLANIPRDSNLTDRFASL